MTRTAQGQRTSETFAKLQKWFGFSDQRLADITGYTISKIEWRRTGKTALDVDDLQRFSEVFKVPPEVFLMAGDEAIRWVIDNGVELDVEVNNYRRRAALRPADQGKRSTMWYTERAGRAHLRAVA